MGFTDSLKKVIGIEQLDENDVVTEEEIMEEKERLAREGRREERSSVTPVVRREREMSQERTPSVSYSSKPREKSFSITGTNSLKLILIEPKGFEECPKLVDNLKARKPVIINLEKLETEIARKIFDFLSGATYALNGNVQKIANNIFIFTPENVAVAATQNRNTMTDTEEERSPWR